MTFLGRLLRLLFWVAVASWSIALLRRIITSLIAPEAQDKESQLPGHSQQLVRDPVCGIHVAAGLALPAKLGGETLYFCSPECRDKYLGTSKKFAANA
jgi:YHS domain-containing protein